MSSLLRAASLAFVLSAFLATGIYAQGDGKVMVVDDTADVPHYFYMMKNYQEHNFYDIQRAYDKFWAKRPKTEKGWKQFERWKWYWETRINDDGSFPDPMDYMNEIMRARGLSFNSTPRGSAPPIPAAPGTPPPPPPAGPPPPGVVSGNWTEVGPMQMNNDLAGMGRVNEVAFHPYNPDKLYVGAPQGGMWISENGGASWTSNTDDLATLGINAIVVDHGDTNNIFMGTGDKDAGDAPGLGVYWSQDHGLTFSPRNNGMAAAATVGQLVQHPVNDSLLIAATSSGIYRTFDKGANWTQERTGNFGDLEFMPGNPSIVFASLESGNGFYRSTDTGNTWTQITSGLPSSGTRTFLATTPADSLYVYVVIVDGRPLEGVYRSTDGGLTFSTMMDQSNGGSINLMGYDSPWTNWTEGQGFYDVDIAVSNTNRDSVFVGGVNVFLSADGGVNWAISAHWFGQGAAEEIHADQHCLEFSPLDNRLYCGNDGGVFWSADPDDYNDISNNLVINQIYNIGQSTLTKDLVLCGTQDNGTNKYDGSWEAVIGGDGFECEVDPTNTTYQYGELYYSDIRRSTGGGFLSIVSGGRITEAGGSAPWNTPFQLDPGNPDRMYVGAQDVWRSDNVRSAASSAAVSWTRIHNYAGTGNRGKALEVSPVDNDLVYVSSTNGTFIRIESASSGSPVVIDLTGSRPGSGTVTDIECHPLDDSTVYITQGREVYKSTDRGMNWTQLSGGAFPNVSANCLVFEKGSLGALYVGTDAGVYYKDSTMGDFTGFFDGLPANSEVTELEIFYDTLTVSNSVMRASTYGRGLWESELYFVDQPPIPNFTADATEVCPAGTITITDLSAFSPTMWNWSISPNTFSFVGGTDSSYQNIELQFSATGYYDVTLIASNAFGDDTLTIDSFIQVTGGEPVPYSEDFETFADCGANNCNTTYSCATSNGWVNSTEDQQDWQGETGPTASGNTGPASDYNPGTIGGTYMYLEGTNGTCIGDTGILISPCIDLSGVLAPAISFAYHMYGADMGNMHLDIYSGGAWINDIMPVKSGNFGNAWFVDTIDLTTYAGQTVFFRWRGVLGNDFTTDMAIDDVNIFETAAPPTVAFDANLTAICAGGQVTFTENSTENPDTFSWTITPAGNFTYIGGTDSTSQNPVVQFNATGNYTVSLIATNLYGSDTLTKSSYISVGTGQSLPYGEDFELFDTCNAFTTCALEVCPLINGWVNDTNGVDDDIDWRTQFGSTPSGQTGNNLVDYNPGNNTGKYLYLEASNCFSQEGRVVSPCIDLATAVAPKLHFAYYMEGADMGTLNLDIFSGGAWVDSIMPEISGNQGNTWQEDTIDLTAYAGQSVYLRFRGMTGGGYRSDILLDDISLFESASPPTAAFTGTTYSCMGATVNYLNQSVNPASGGMTYQWFFPGGTPATDTAQNPAVTYNAGGMYDVTLIATNLYGSDTITQSNFINIDTTSNATPVELELLTDQFPGESGWRLEDTSGNLLFSAAAGTYTGIGTTYNQLFCLGDGCFRFIATDGFGDGLSAGPPVGYMELTRLDSGSVLGTITGNFGTTDTIEFCFLSFAENGYDTIAQSLCEGDTLLLKSGDELLASSDTAFSDTLAGVTPSGGDSVFWYDLTVITAAPDTIQDTFCFGTPYIFGSDTINSPGTYDDTFASSAGCDSVVVLELEVKVPPYTNFATTICSNDTYDVFGIKYTTAQVISDTLIGGAANGCDTIVEITLNVNPAYSQNFFADECEGDTIYVGSSAYGTTGMYSDTLSSIDGCDSVVNLDLTIHPVYDTTVYDTICQGDTLVIDGITYTGSGVYVYDLATVEGCDSTTTHAIAQGSGDTVITSFDTICFGDTFFLGSTPLTTSGVYGDTFSSSGGCDSVVGVDLHVRAKQENNQVENICQGDSYTWGNGMTYSSAGTYYDTSSGQFGCDSFSSLLLVVQSPARDTISAFECFGQTYSFGGNSLSSSGTYYDTIASGSCDSIVMLVLTIRDEARDTISDQFCEGGSYNFGGNSLTAPGTYDDTLTGGDGCDSVLVLVLSENPIARDTISQSICDGDTYSFGGNSYGSSGNYYDTGTGSNSCDSITMLQLTVLPLLTDSSSATICDGQQYSFAGNNYSATGNYYDTALGSNGCDSIHKLILTVNAAQDSTVNASICPGGNFVFNSVTYDSAGTYFDTLSGNPCKYYTINVSVASVTNTSINDTICSGQYYTFGADSYNSSGTYYDSLSTAGGCDSIVQLDLFVNPPLIDSFDVELCDGQSYTHGGTTYTTTGFYNDTLTASTGCDSISRLILGFYSSVDTTINASICAGGNFVFNGDTYTAAGTYFDTLGANACRYFTINVSVNASTSTSLDDTICSGQSYSFGGNVYSSSGTYFDTLSTGAGCDSIVQLDLFVRAPLRDSVFTDICPGEFVVFGGDTFNTSGDYYDTLVGSGGCDSIRKLSLFVKPDYATTIADTICDGDSYTFGGNSYSAAGTYFDTLSAVNTCDSVVQLDLTVLSTASTTIADTICDGDTYSFGGNTYSASGSFFDTLAAANSCDSLVQLDLHVRPQKIQSISTGICSGDSFVVGTSMYTVAGSYSDTLTASDGCDSLVNLSLTVDSLISIDLFDSICTGATYVFAGNTISSAGIYRDTTSSASGCDSITTLDLFVRPVRSDSLSQSICPGDVLIFGGDTIGSAGTYRDTLSDEHGCDSFATLTVVQLSDASFTFADTICNGDSYSFGGSSYNSAGAYFDTLSSSNGCDSVVRLDLVVNNPSSFSLEDTICNGQTYNFGGNSISTAGTYFDTLTAGNGCDSIVTLDLTVENAAIVSVSDTFCSGSFYVFGPDSLTIGGSYTDTLSAANGCDSVVNLNLVARSPSTETNNLSICDGDSVVVGSSVYKTDGNYRDTFTSSLGCDSIITTNLTVITTTPDTVDATTCSGTTYNFGGNLLSSAGQYVDTFAAFAGCDSVVVLNLLIDSNSFAGVNDTVCDQAFYLFGGDSLTLSGTYFDTLSNQWGCDSVVELRLFMFNSASTSLNEAICAGNSYAFGGNTYSSSGTYFDTLSTTGGCDSIVTLNLTVNSIAPQNLTPSICEGASFNVGTSTYTVGGSYSDTLTGAGGCDSVINTTLTVLSVERDTIVQQLCFGQSFNFDGSNLSSSGLYRDTLSGSNGCDSIVLLDLTVDPQLQTSISTGICQGDSFMVGTSVYTSAGVYADTLAGTNGCDSVVDLNLAVDSLILVALDDTICPGEFVPFGGSNVFTAGSYADTTVSASGCDSISTLELLVNSTSSTFSSADICDGDTFNFGGQLLTVSNTYSDTLVNAAGCDSIVSLNLTVNSNAFISIADTICGGTSYVFGGSSLSASGSYFDTLASFNGCDSIVQLDLLVRAAAVSSFADTICASASYSFAGNTYTTSGNYNDTLTAANGCDSIVSLQLTVLPLGANTLNVFICDGDVFGFAGNSLSAAGTYFDTLTAANGCDSIVTLNLNVSPNALDTLVASICAGDSFQMGSNFYSAAGFYIDTFIAFNGCDSVQVLDLSVSSLIQISLNDTICNGQTYVFGGASLTTAGFYSDTATSSGGCDSVTTLDLIVNNPVSSSIADTICNGDVYNFGGSGLTTAGSYLDTLTAFNGCDSVVSLQLAVSTVTTNSLSVSICSGDNYNFGGNLLNSAGVYTDTFNSFNGCDSIVTLTLGVNSIVVVNQSASICDGAGYSFGASVLTVGGSYSDTTSGSNGCDSITNLNLTVLPNSSVLVADTICDNQAYVFGGVNRTLSGTYFDTLVSANGCDSIVRLDLLVEATASSTINQSICAGDTYSFGGNALGISNTYFDTLAAANGCDSIVTLNLSVLPVSTTVIDDTICAGDSYSFDGNSLTAAGTYFDTLPAANSCDSIVTLNLVVNQVADDSLSAAICAGSNFNFNGTLLTTSGTYFDTLTSGNGCDSTIVLFLSVDSVVLDTINADICPGSTYSFGGKSYNLSGSYSDSLTAVSGCDSIVTLNLNVFSLNLTNFRDTVCNGQTYSFAGNTLSASGTYWDTLSGSNGCDSLVAVNLMVMPPSGQNLRDTICNGDVYNFGGQLLSSPGVYFDTMTDQYGCDSISRFELVVRPSAASSLADTICAGDTYLFAGNSLNAGGIYTDTLLAANGCDSIVSLSLLVLPNAASSISQSVCPGGSFIFGGSSLSIAGTYFDTLAAANGCDSIVTLTLTQLSNPTATVNDSICPGGSYVFGSVTYFAAGTYFDTLAAANGCDSFVVLNLGIRATSGSSLNQTICQGSSFSFGGNNYSLSGTYRDTLVGANGCDSIVGLNLMVTPTKVFNLNVNLCEGQQFTVGSNTYFLTGGYSDTMTASSGCDSIVNLNLSVGDTFQTFIADTICPGGVYQMGGLSFTAAGSYQQQLSSRSGCDSTVFLELAIRNPDTTYIADTICQGTLRFVAGRFFDSTGVYTVDLTSTKGCDSAVVLDLLVRPRQNSTRFDTICAGDTFFYSVNTYTVSGLYSVIHPDQYGCDSLVFLWLHVMNSISSNVFHDMCEGDTFTAGGQSFTREGQYTIPMIASNGCDSMVFLDLGVAAAPQAEFIWFNNSGNDVSFTNLSDNAVFFDWDFGDGTASTAFEPTRSYNSAGTYIVELKAGNDNCPDDSYIDTVRLISTDLGSLLDGRVLFNIYPNPSDGFFNVALDGLNGQFVSIEIYDARGRLVYLHNEDKAPAALRHEVSLMDAAAGVYMLKLQVENEIVTRKLILE